VYRQARAAHQRAQAVYRQAQAGRRAA
jgi:hypothetical protein